MNDLVEYKDHSVIVMDNIPPFCEEEYDLFDKTDFKKYVQDGENLIKILPCLYSFLSLTMAISIVPPFVEKTVLKLQVSSSTAVIRAKSEFVARTKSSLLPND